MASFPPTTAAAVANEFLRLGSAELNIPAIDQMKLQKLLFYAHGWYLGMEGKPLLEENFCAWPWGPVIGGIYSQTRKYGRGPVTERIYELRKTGDNPLDFNFHTPEGVHEDLKTYIKQIWDVHKIYTGIQLSNSTHAQGEPWSIMKAHYRTLGRKPTIPNALIESVFKGKLHEIRNPPGCAVQRRGGSCLDYVP